MGKKPSPREFQRRLRQYTAEYDALKARLQDIGFICTGSLAIRWTTCGKPNCSCARNLDQRHGPYYQLTWKENGVTVTRRLPPEHAQLYQHWIANRHLLESVLEQMQHVSAKAGQQLLRATGLSSPSDSTPPRKRPRRHS
jgi:hypothetical protein